MPVGELAKPARCQRMRFLRITKVGDRVALQAVRAALQDDELGLGIVDVGFDQLPGLVELLVPGARRHRDIQLGAGRGAGAGLVDGPGSRVEKASVFVQVRKYQVGIVFESVEDTVAVMRVDIDIGDAAQAVLLAQVLDRDAAIVEHAKTCRVLPARVV